MTRSVLKIKLLLRLLNLCSEGNLLWLIASKEKTEFLFFVLSVLGFLGHPGVVRTKRGDNPAREK